MDCCSNGASGWVRNSTKKAASFSLVELLVVISILAVLMSILSPSLRRMSHTSGDLKCSNNLKNIGVGYSIYADDHNDYYPDVLPLPFSQRWKPRERYPFFYADKYGYDRRPQLRPYFGGYLGSTFICPLTVEGGLEWGNDIEVDPKLPESHSDYLFPNKKIMGYSVFVGTFKQDKISSFSSAAQRIGDPFRMAGDGANIPHPTLPISYALAGDVLKGMQIWSSGSYLNSYIKTLHQPSFSASYVAKPDIHGNPAKFDYIEFSTNYCFQDGSVKAVKGICHKASLKETHASIQSESNQEKPLLPLEDSLR
jgi:prepilin-type N-terminal cleavage/methylation domain-containing protein